MLLPYQMDACYDYRGQCWTLLGITGVLILVALYLMFIGLSFPAKPGVTGGPKDRPTPAWLQGSGGESPAPREEPVVNHVFEGARSTS